MHITDYLVRIAEEITDRPLPRFANRDEFLTWRQERQTQFHKMLGIDTYLHQPRTDLNTTITGTVQRDTYRIDKLYFESLPGLYVAANLYIPDQEEKPMPAILLLCGHATKQKVRYQEHARRFAQLGFVVLVLDTIQLGEVRGVHHGTYKHGWFHWISKGYTPAAVEVWNAIRGLDLLSELQEVDRDRLGVTGNSGGGAMTWWTACADDRVKVLAPSCGTGTIASHIREQTIDGHCDCMFPNNPYGWSLIEMYALVAPRPLLIATPDRDRLFSIDSVRMVYRRMKGFYDALGFKNSISFVEFPGPHGYSPESRKAISHWFLRHLMNKDIRLRDVKDFDGFKEKEEDLLVYKDMIPANDESTSVQDWFIPLQPLPDITTSEELVCMRKSLIAKLKLESFAAFPVQRAKPELQIIQQSVDKNDHWYHKFSYMTEHEWRLSGNIQGHHKTLHISSPTAIHIRSAEDGREEADLQMLDGLNEKWLKAWLDVRGTGRTAWGAELNWFIRRSLALTGRTVASLRIWDTLRGIQAMRTLSQVDAKQLVLAGKGEMAVVALYAALLDGDISAVILEDPPASLNEPGDGKGMDAPVEILNALRHADLPLIAALLWPTSLIFIGDRPESYRYTETIYRQLGNPGGTWRVKAGAQWPNLGGM